MTLAPEKKVNMIKVSMARKATRPKKAPIWIGGETTVAQVTGQVVALLAVRAGVRGVLVAVRAVVTGVALAGTRVVAAASTSIYCPSVGFLVPSQLVFLNKKSIRD
ncbi:MAG: hypothetical protein ABS69_10130 [Nitrosomonadales bacterium SCN 54-20]|nr:MAG: hypothetical protein ABS69_10130 [Nitrosomonadales bacterium SCN 54-20]